MNTRAFLRERTEMISKHFADIQKMSAQKNLRADDDGRTTALTESEPARHRAEAARPRAKGGPGA